MHNALILQYQSRAGAKGQIQSVSAEAFAAQLALVRKQKMPVVSLDELVENDKKRKRWHRHVLLLTFTDTFLAQNPTVFQHLKASGFPATVFISTHEDQELERRKFWQEVVAAGFSLGLHSVFQVPLSKIPEAEIREELTAEKRIFEAETGQPVKFLLPAFGDNHKKIVAAAQELGFEAILSGKVGYNRFNADLLHLKTWPVPAQTSLKAFEHMLCRDKKELLVQEMKAKALKNGRVLKPKSLFGKLKGLFRRVKV
ncbi:polysaccharide deacetylase family protein [Adhaeribacter terreus]|uniref:Polysaccharide deacetylase family protein n=1 Tax=Adhaeribacter terreus TaxID=529703 RepID=A0ABW0E485_9BACT